MNTLDFYITHLYPKELSIYGDMGNIHAMRWVLEDSGYKVHYIGVNLGEELPERTDFYFIGGGQDEEQFRVYSDLILKKDSLLKDIAQGVPLLAICGGYQILGESFIAGDGRVLQGLGLFPVETRAPSKKTSERCIGDISIECLIPELRGVKLVGFENHSGQTEFTNKDTSKAYPLGNVIKGNGNKRNGKVEGCVIQNAVGTYLHGPCLPKNPELTEFFIRKGLKVEKNTKLPFPDHTLSLKAKDERLRLV